MLTLLKYLRCTVCHCPSLRPPGTVGLTTVLDSPVGRMHLEGCLELRSCPPPTSCRHSYSQGDPACLRSPPTHTLVTTLAGRECLWTDRRSTHSLERCTFPQGMATGTRPSLGPFGMEVHVKVCSEANLRGLGACTRARLAHICTHWPAHTPAAPTRGVCEPRLPRHQLQGQEVVLLIQAPVVEEKAARLHCREPGWGGQGGSQARHLFSPTTHPQEGWPGGRFPPGLWGAGRKEEVMREGGTAR